MTDSTYDVLSIKANYEASVQLCAAQGRTLPMPKTQAENDALDALTDGGGDFFLGLSDAETEGAWLWADGSVLEWSDWMQAGEAPWGAEPNGGAGENYAVMMKDVVKAAYSHRWADVRASREAGQVVCQAAAVGGGHAPGGGLGGVKLGQL